MQHRRDAITLWEYTKNIEPAFNCRLHSILTYELLQAAGIEARFITCMPEDSQDNDCHVVNHVWLPELNKWAMLDSDMGGNWASDSTGMPLSLLEMEPSLNKTRRGKYLIITDLTRAVMNSHAPLL